MLHGKLQNILFLKKNRCPFVSWLKRFAESAEHFDLSLPKNHSTWQRLFSPALAEQAEEEELSKDPPLKAKKNPTKTSLS